MKRWSVAVTVFGLVTAVQAQAPDPLAAFGWLKDLTGACWRAQVGPMTDTQCYRVQFGRYLRGTIELRNAAGELAVEGDSLFERDPKTGTVRYWLWSNRAGVGQGELVIDGDALVFADPARADGQQLRSRWLREADGYRVLREKRDGERWIEQLAASYRRVPGLTP